MVSIIHSEKPKGRGKEEGNQFLSAQLIKMSESGFGKGILQQKGRE